MALFGHSRDILRRNQMPSPSPYGTRNPADILAMGEAAKQAGANPSTMALERGARAMPPEVSGAPQMPVPSQSQEMGAMAMPPVASQAPAAHPQGGFDYEGAGRALAGDQRRPQWWQYLAAGVGDALTNQYGGGLGHSALGLLQRRDMQQQDRLNQAAATLANWRYRDFARQDQADLNASRPFTIGRDRMQYDPRSGQTNMLYDGQQDFEQYAATLGLEEGSPEYFQAVEDYVLRGGGPSAHARDIELDGVRTQNDERLDDYRTRNDRGLEDLRFRNRLSMESQRQRNRVDLKLTPGRSGGEDLPVVSSPAEAAILPSGTRFRTPDGRVKVKPGCGPIRGLRSLTLSQGQGQRKSAGA